MNRYCAMLTALEAIGTLYNHAVAAHECRRLKIAHVTHKKSVSGGINDKVISMQRKRSATADNILVSISLLGNIFYNLPMQLPRLFESEGIAVGVFVFSEYLRKNRHLEISCLFTTFIIYFTINRKKMEYLFQ